MASSNVGQKKQISAGLVEAATQIRFVVFDNQTIFSSNVHQCSSFLDHYSKIAATTLAI